MHGALHSKSESACAATLRVHVQQGHKSRNNTCTTHKQQTLTGLRATFAVHPVQPGGGRLVQAEWAKPGTLLCLGVAAGRQHQGDQKTTSPPAGHLLRSALLGRPELQASRHVRWVLSCCEEQQVQLPLGCCVAIQHAYVLNLAVKSESPEACRELCTVQTETVNTPPDSVCSACCATLGRLIINADAQSDMCIV